MQENKKLVWWVVVIIIILVLAAFVVFYMQNPSAESPGANSQIAPADSVSSIEADLKVTNVNNLGSELSDIDKELAK